MRFSSIFAPRKKPHQPEIASDSLAHPGSAACDSLVSPSPTPQPISGHPSLSQPASPETALFNFNWFLPTQAAWLNDPWPLKIWEKSRQVGATKTDALDSVLKASHADAKFDVWVSSRDDVQSRLYLEDCKDWATILNLAATDLGMLLFDPKNGFSAHVLQFANGRRIYCL